MTGTPEGGRGEEEVMDMETVKFGLLLTIIPFTVIFLIITIWWAIVDMSARKLPGTQRAIWTLLVLLLPPLGAFLYRLANRGQSIHNLRFQQG